MTFLKTLYAILKPRSIHRALPFRDVMRLTRAFVKSHYGVLCLYGKGFRVKVTSIITGKNIIHLEPVSDRDVFADFLDKYEVEYSFPKGRCKIYFCHRIPERASTNVIPIDEFVRNIMAHLYSEPGRLSFYLKTADLDSEKLLVAKCLTPA